MSEEKNQITKCKKHSHTQTKTLEDTEKFNTLAQKSRQHKRIRHKRQKKSKQKSPPKWRKCNTFLTDEFMMNIYSCKHLTVFDFLFHSFNNNLVCVTWYTQNGDIYPFRFTFPFTNSKQILVLFTFSIFFHSACLDYISYFV